MDADLDQLFTVRAAARKSSARRWATPLTTTAIAAAARARRRCGMRSPRPARVLAPWRSSGRPGSALVNYCA